jgi:ABC-type branched-subunit amino acid transport system ATPase component/ABC-type branched-subunit amino acid transport system permease subunit
MMSSVVTLALEFPRQSIFSGVMQGLTYGVIAIGLILIYRSTRVINFAIVEMGAFSAALLARLIINWGVSYWVALPACVIVGGVLGAGIELVVVRRLFRSPRIVLFVATIGLAQLLLFFQFELPKFDTYASFPTAFTHTWEVQGVLIRSEHLLVLVIVPLLAIVLTVFLNHTKYGMAIRASAANPDAARLSSISPKKMSTLVWTIAGLLAALGMILTIPLTSSAATETITLGPGVLLRAIVAALIGGMFSMPRAVVGGVAIGITEALLFYNYPSQVGLLDGVLFVAVLAIMLVMGSRDRDTDHVDAWSFSPRVRPVPANLQGLWLVRNLPRLGTALAVFAAVVFPFIVTRPSQQLLFSRVLIYALVTLSLTVLTGWAGQLSLGQFALAGIGAFGTAGLMREGLSFGVSVLLVTVIGMIVALVIGAPALRLRGLFLAIATLAFAIAASSWLFRRPFLLPDGLSVQVHRGEILGIDLTPQRTYYFFCLVVLAIAVYFVVQIRRSGVGRSFIAVRDNEQSSAAVALSPVRTKLTAFVIAGGLAALAGALLAGLLVNFEPTGFPERFGAAESLSVVAMAVIGGLSSIPGAVLGALWVVGIPSLVPDSPEVALFTSGAGLLILLLYFPAGLVQILYSVRDLLFGWLGKRLPPAGEAPRVTVTTGKRLTPRRVAAAETEVALQVRALTVKFGKRVVVDHVDLQVGAHETVGLIGANGAGKTTLMNAVGGFLSSDGTVVLEGRDVSRASPTRRAALGLGRSFQHARLFADLTVRETIEVALESGAHAGPIAVGLALPRARRFERAKRAQAAEIIAFLGLGGYADRFINELSTGTRRIVELACLVAVEPRVLCLDEPTAGIAQRETEAFGPLILRVREELHASLLVIEHDMPLVMGISDRIYCLEAGRVISEGTPEWVRRDQAVIASYLGTDEQAIARSGVAATSPSTDNIEPASVDLV